MLNNLSIKKTLYCIVTKKGEEGGARSALRSLFWFTREMQGLPIDFTSALVKITGFIENWLFL